MYRITINGNEYPCNWCSVDNGLLVFSLAGMDFYQALEAVNDAFTFVFIFGEMQDQYEGYNRIKSIITADENAIVTMKKG